MLSPALASVAATDQAFVNLDLMDSANAVALRADHSGPQLVKDLKGGFIATQAKLALELKRGLAGRLGCY
jgi:hypothetical protein